MAQLNFPDPSFSTTYTAAGITWTWNPTLELWSSEPGESGGGGGTNVTVSTTPPADAEQGDLWWNNDFFSGRLYVYYADGNSEQWVEASPEGSGLTENDTDGLYLSKVNDDTAAGKITFDAGLISNDRVGIGTDAPQAELDVAGDIHASRSAGNSQRLTLECNSGGNFITSKSSDSSKKHLYIENSSSTQSVIIKTGGSNSFAVNSDGNVGVGTDGPQARLHISNNQGGATGRILFDADVTSGYDTLIDATDTGLEFTAKSNSRGFVFNTGSTPTSKLTILGNGRVGIGTDTPQANLDVATVSATDESIYFKGGYTRGLQINDVTKAGSPNSGDLTRFYKGSNSGSYSFSNSGRELVRFDGAGNVGIGVDDPQAKLDIEAPYTSIDSNPILTFAREGGAVKGVTGYDATVETGPSIYTGTVTSHKFQIRVNNNIAQTFNTDGSVNFAGTTTHEDGVSVAGGSLPTNKSSGFFGTQPEGADNTSLTAYATEGSTGLPRVIWESPGNRLGLMGSADSKAHVHVNGDMNVAGTQANNYAFWVFPNSVDTTRSGSIQLITARFPGTTKGSLSNIFNFSCEDANTAISDIYGFNSNISSGASNRYNFFAAGTAPSRIPNLQTTYSAFLDISELDQTDSEGNPINWEQPTAATVGTGIYRNEAGALCFARNGECALEIGNGQAIGNLIDKLESIEARLAALEGA